MTYCLALSSSCHQPGATQSGGMGGRGCWADAQRTGELARGVLADQCAQNPGAGNSQYSGEPVMAVTSGVFLCPARGTQWIDDCRLLPADRDGWARPHRRHQHKPTSGKIDVGIAGRVDF